MKDVVRRLGTKTGGGKLSDRMSTTKIKRKKSSEKSIVIRDRT